MDGQRQNDKILSVWMALHQIDDKSCNFFISGCTWMRSLIIVGAVNSIGRVDYGEYSEAQLSDIDGSAGSTWYI